MYFKRNIDEKLQEHFNQEDPTPLILQGPPRIGKRTSLLHLKDNFNQVQTVDLINFKSKSPEYINKKYTQLIHTVSDQTGNDFLNNSDNLLILLNANNIVGLYETIIKLGEVWKCKIAVTITHIDCLGDKYYDDKLLNVMKMERMQMKEFSQICYERGLTRGKDIFAMYKQCGGYPEFLEPICDISKSIVAPEHFVTSYIINFSKEFGYDYTIVLEVLTAFAELALAQHFTFTDLTFELSDYLERTYFGFSLNEAQLKKLLSGLISYGILVKSKIYDVENENGISYSAMCFTDFVFHSYFTKKVLCQKRTRDLADLEFFTFDAFRFDTNLTGLSTYFCKGTLGYKIGNCLSQKKTLKEQEMPFFMIQEVSSGKRTFITFSKVIEDKLLKLNPDAKIVSYEMGKEYKLYGLELEEDE